MDSICTPSERLSTPLKLGALHIGHRVFFADQLPLTGRIPEVLQKALQDARDMQPAVEGRLVLCTLAPTQPIWHTGAVDLGLRSAYEVNGWRAITDTIHAGGGVAVARLGNVHACADAFPSHEELDEALDGYRTVAENAGDAGFDGVELIGTTGSLPARLLSATSEFASTIGARIERPLSLDFLVGAFDAMLGAWGADRMGLSLSLPREEDQLEVELQAISAIEPLDLAFLHMTSLTSTQTASLGQATSRMRAVFQGGLLVSGDWTRALAEAALQSGEVDAVGISSEMKWLTTQAERRQVAEMVSR